jgi:hypothetical protein
LNVFDFAGFWPIEDCLDFAFVHAEAVSSEDIAEVFDFHLVPFTFGWTSIEAMFSESP